MREFVSRHSQLQHVRGIAYVVRHDKWHGPMLEVSISRDIMRDAGWSIGTLVDVEWDKCRMYLVRRKDGMYKLRFSHTSYRCHPQASHAGRFVGWLKCTWKAETGLPDIPKRAMCGEIHVGNRVVSFRLPSISNRKRRGDVVQGADKD